MQSQLESIKKKLKEQREEAERYLDEKEKLEQELANVLASKAETVKQAELLLAKQRELDNLLDERQSELSQVVTSLLHVYYFHKMINTTHTIAVSVEV